MIVKHHYIREWFDRSDVSLKEVAAIIGLTKPKSLLEITSGWPKADQMKSLAALMSIDPRFFFVHPDDAGPEPPFKEEAFERLELLARLEWLR